MNPTELDGKAKEMAFVELLPGWCGLPHSSALMLVGCVAAWAAAEELVRRGSGGPKSAYQFGILKGSRTKEAMLESEAQKKVRAVLEQSKGPFIANKF